MFEYKTELYVDEEMVQTLLNAYSGHGYRLHTIIGHNDRDGTNYYVMIFERKKTVDNNSLGVYTVLNEGVTETGLVPTTH